MSLERSLDLANNAVTVAITQFFGFTRIEVQRIICCALRDHPQAYLYQSIISHP